MPMETGNPFAEYVHANFTKAYAGKDFNIYLRNDQADALLHGGSGGVLTPNRALGATSTWVADAGQATWAADAAASVDDVIELSPSMCTRVSGTYTAAPGAGGSFLSFRFDGVRSTDETMRLNIADTEVFSGNDATVFDSVILDPATVDTAQPSPPDTASHAFAVVVGAHSAALVVDGQIRAAVRLPNPARLVLEMRKGGVLLRNLQVGAPPPNSGCP